MPKRFSPRMIGLTTIERSLRRSHSTTRGSGLGLVASERTLASTRCLTACRSTGVDRDEIALLRTGQQPVHQAFIWRRRDASQPILVGVESLDLELLARLDAIPLAKLRWQHDLTLGRDGRFH